MEFVLNVQRNYTRNLIPIRRTDYTKITRLATIQEGWRPLFKSEVIREQPPQGSNSQMKPAKLLFADIPVPHWSDIRRGAIVGFLRTSLLSRGNTIGSGPTSLLRKRFNREIGGGLSRKEVVERRGCSSRLKSLPPDCRYPFVIGYSLFSPVGA